MTIYSKLNSTLNTLDGVLADFKEIQLETSDNEIKKKFYSMIKLTDDIINKLSVRLECIQKEESQYKEK